MSNHKPFDSDQQYLDFVKHFTNLCDQQFIIYEDQIKDSSNFDNIIKHLPALISLVNTISYLRGQDGMFIGIRPTVGDKQDLLYKYENAFIKRLEHIIQAIMSSPQKENYLTELEQYFISRNSIK